MGHLTQSTPFGRNRLPRCRLFAAVCMAWALTAADPTSVAAGETAPARKDFNVPAGSAADALRLFSTQSGHEVVFAADTPAGVKTHAVIGKYAPDEAVKLLLAGTGLTANQDPASGAFMVNRARDPNVPDTSPSRGSLSP